jgi:hypothetical protein
MVLAPRAGRPGRPAWRAGREGHYGTCGVFSSIDLIIRKSLPDLLAKRINRQDLREEV